MKTSNWINVNDRLPESIDNVIVYIDNDGYKFITSLYHTGSGWSEYYNVLYWQPLPPPPSLPEITEDF